MGKLDGKTAIVTGAARGLGRVYAHRVASLGASVAVWDADLRSYADFAGKAAQMTAASTVDEIIAGGGEAIGFEFDIADRDAAFAAIPTRRRSTRSCLTSSPAQTSTALSGPAARWPRS
jgi:3-oxoacyl-[acyl-carrier protein] reductase